MRNHLRAGEFLVKYGYLTHFNKMSYTVKSTDINVS